MKHIKTMLSGFLAGILISLGGFVFLYLKCVGTVGALETAIGGFMFSFGLLMICAFSLNLYTGKIGFCIGKDKYYFLDLLEMLAGNILGCIIFGYLLSLTRVYDIQGTTSTFEEVVKSVCTTKANDPWYSLLVLSFGCGILVYLAVRIFKSEHHAFIRVLGLMFAVALFVIVGFEHVIADVFYFALAGMCSWRIVLNLFIIFIGNSLGSIFFHSVLSLLEKKNIDKESTNM